MDRQELSWTTHWCQPLRPLILQYHDTIRYDYDTMQYFNVRSKLRRILDIRWHDFFRNVDVRRITNKPPLSSIIKSRRLTLFGRLA